MKSLCYLVGSLFLAGWLTAGPATAAESNFFRGKMPQAPAGQTAPVAAQTTQAQAPAATAQQYVDPNDPAYLAFFPKPQRQGNIEVRLEPTRALGDRALVVGFGLPFPPGFLDDSKLLKVRDAKGQEVPIAVTELARWWGPMPGSGSVRTVLIQFQDNYADGKAHSYLITWGVPRAQSVAKPWPPDQDWAPVNEPDYPGGVVREPPVYATLPPDWLCQSLITNRMQKLYACQEYERVDVGISKYYYQNINQLPNANDQTKSKYRVNYLESGEPWLYDRSATLYMLYFKTGQASVLRQAHRAAEYYARHITERGQFDLLECHPCFNLKYVNQQSVTFDYLLFGNPLMKQTTMLHAKQYPEWDPVLSASRSFWTERNLASYLNGALGTYEMTGDPKWLDMARAAFEIGLKAQTDNPIPGAPKLGCMVHRNWQHGNKGDKWICVPWMTTLFMDAALRYYLFSADTRVATSARLMAEFVGQYGLYKRYFEKYKREITLPYYEVNADGPVGEVQPYDDWQHSVDVGMLFVYDIYFSRHHGQPYEKSLKHFQDLYDTALEDIGSANAALHVVLTKRKYNWYYRTSANLSWLMCSQRKK